MTSSTALLHAENVARRHPDGRRWLLEDVSLEVDAGSRLSVVGASGSGKTLLLRAMVLLDPLDGGRVCWRGSPVRHDRIPGFRSAAIYLHQRPALLEDEDHVEAALRRPFSLKVHHHRQFDRQQILRWLDRLGRGASFLAKRTGDLSGGEIQVVALLRALQLDPAVLLLDEPTAALDPPTTAAVENLVRHWVEDSTEGRAFVWVTHDPQQAGRVAQTTLHMHRGRIRDE